MTHEQMADARARIDRKLADAAKAKLGCDVALTRWTEPDRYGAQIPVFRVPLSKADEARALGLTVDAS